MSTAPGASYDNKVVTFKRRSKVMDDTGASDYVFEPISAELTRFPCGYRPDRGWERRENERNQSAQMGVLRVRSCNSTRALRTDDIAVVHFGEGDTRNETFQITYVDNRDRHDRFLYITVESPPVVQ